MKKISVIIPCYNGAAVISRSIESVYAQSCTASVELIVVDDGSSDNSQQEIMNWLPRFEAKGYRLKYVYQKNRGLGGSIDTGLKFVSGDYLTLLDADDAFLPGSFQKRLDFLETHPDYVGVRTNGWQDKQGVRSLFETDSTWKENTNLFDGLIGGTATNWAGSYMVRTEPLFRFYPTRHIFPSRFGQNMQILLPLAYKQKFGYIDEPLMVYYLQENSHSQAATQEEQLQKDDRNFYGYLDIYSCVIKQVISDPEEYRYYCNILQSWKCNHDMSKAIYSNDFIGARHAYLAYRATGRIPLNRKIEYYTYANKPMALLLKTFRRFLAAINFQKNK